MVMGDNRINNYKKCRQIDDNFDRHAAGAIRGNVHCPMEHLWLDAKPLDAIVGQVPAPYRPGGRHG
jgi:hypothetical protein